METRFGHEIDMMDHASCAMIPVGVGNKSVDGQSAAIGLSHAVLAARIPVSLTLAIGKYGSQSLWKPVLTTKLT